MFTKCGHISPNVLIHLSIISGVDFRRLQGGNKIKANCRWAGTCHGQVVGVMSIQPWENGYNQSDFRGWSLCAVTAVRPIKCVVLSMCLNMVQ